MGIDWDGFCNLLCTRFGRDRHQLLIRQFYTLKQTSTVADYIERFEHIMNHLMAYFDAIHPLYFLTHFVEGLRDDVRAVVMVQRPPNLAAACAPAALHEEVIDSMRCDRYPRITTAARGSGPLPLPPPPTPLRLTAPPRVVDCATQDSVKSGQDLSRLSTLRDYRRARGLCFKCGERWSKDHVCPSTVQLHFVEELLEFMGLDEAGSSASSKQTENEVVMSISRQAVTGGDTPKAIQLQGWVQGNQVLILIDSGSTTSFLTQHLVPRLSGLKQLQQVTKVKVAGGQVLSCSQELPACSWFTQGYEFANTFKILPLEVYDAILGMDWLEAHSPMQVDWVAKQLQFDRNGQQVNLQGIRQHNSSCLSITHCQYMGMCKQGAVTQTVQVYAVDESACFYSPGCPTALATVSSCFCNTY